ncbi:MAG: glycoside hydrolase family 20 zincin-like fold domain-containing protein [Bacteroides xylanisolvens]
MKKVLFIGLILFVVSTLFAQDNLSALIPMPNKIISSSSGSLELQGKSIACYVQADSLSFELKKVSSIFEKRFGLDIKRVTKKSRAQIHLLVDKSLSKNDHYQLSVNEKRLEIRGASAAAVCYGLMTLDQLLVGDVCATKQQKITAIEIDDCPRFGYRALMAQSETLGDCVKILIFAS